jgi:LmbE family N-acetylglucosaminyl deacetylase
MVRRATWPTPGDWALHPARLNAQARVREADAALAVLGVDPDRVCRLGLRDQDVAFEMAALSEACAELIEELQPAAVLTHAYEGGHPDHDAVALAVHLACRCLRETGVVPPDLIEFAGYHDPDGSGRITTPRSFCPRPSLVCRCASSPTSSLASAVPWRASAPSRSCCACSAPTERPFRAAPRYRFTRPPHAWRPFYERFLLRLEGAGWRRLARRTLRSHSITGPL